MRARFLCVAPDGETVLSVLLMSEADAVLNTPPGGSLVAIADDSGAVIRAGAVKLVGGALVDPGTGVPVESLSGLSLIVL